MRYPAHFSSGKSLILTYFASRILPKIEEMMNSGSQLEIATSPVIATVIVSPRLMVNDE